MSGHRKVRSALLLAIAVVAAVGVFVAAPADASSPPDGHSVASGSSVTWKVSPWVSISAPVFHVTVKQVSCPTDALCQAVGDYWGLDGRDHPLVETWNGSTWDLATLPPARGLFNRLLHVSCASSSSCLAIGIHDASNGPRTPFGLRWNGSTWLRLDTTGLTTFAPRDLSC